MSSTVRHILGSFLRLYAQPDAKVRLLFATPSGDRHEIGTLGAAMLAASSGLGVAYLGPDLPAREIVESVKPAGAQVLVLGLTTASAGKPRERELRAIVRDLPRDSSCGPAAAAPNATPRSSAREDWSSRLPRIPTGARAPRRTRTVTPVRTCEHVRCAFTRVSCARRHRLEPCLHVGAGTGHHRRGRHQRRRGERGRRAGPGVRVCALDTTPAPPATPRAPFVSANCVRVRTAWR